MVRFYEIKDDKITVYKHRVYGPVQIAFATIFTPLLIYLLVNDIPPKYRIASLVIVAIATPLILSYLQFEKIVFDLKAKTVYRWLPVIGNRHIAEFSEIAGISFVPINRGILSPLIKQASYCSIILKRDRLDSGVKLLTQIKNNREELVPFNEDVVNPLNQLFYAQQADVLIPNSSQAGAGQQSFKYLKETKTGVFTLGVSVWSWVKIVFWFVLLYIMYQAFIQGAGVKDYIDVIIYVGFPALFAYRIYVDSATLEFDVINRVVVSKHLGPLIRKRYDFSEFSNFYAVHNKPEIIYGTDLYLLMQDNKLIFVAGARNTAKLNEIEAELRRIIN